MAGAGFARVMTGFGFLAGAGSFTIRARLADLVDGLVADFFDDFLTVFFTTVFFAADFLEVFLTVFLTVFWAFFAARLPVLTLFLAALFLARFFDAAALAARARDDFRALAAFGLPAVFFVDFATTNSFMAQTRLSGVI